MPEGACDMLEKLLNRPEVQQVTATLSPEMLDRRHYADERHEQRIGYGNALEGEHGPARPIAFCGLINQVIVAFRIIGNINL